MEKKNTSETIKQHYVPRTYLKNFGYQKNKDYYVNVLPKNKSIEHLFECNIKKICSEKHLYTLMGDCNERQILEDVYSNVFENKYPELYEILTNDNKLEINSELKRSIVSTIITMYFRAKKWLSIMNDFNSEVMDKAFQFCHHYKVDYYKDPNGNKINLQGKSLKELQHDIKEENRIPYVLNLFEFALKMIDLKINDNIYVYKIDGNYNFITSDNPVFAQNINNKDTIPFDVDNILFLPINKKYLLSISPTKCSVANYKILRLPMTQKQVENINKIQVMNCDKFIIGEKLELIQSTK